jgi:uncharacterized protein (DUF488 family)
VLKGLAKYRVALLCAEKDPLTCHRTILVCRHLRGRGFPIQHILADGSLESHEQAEERLLKRFEMEHPSLFVDHNERVEWAYDEQGLKIAYHQHSPLAEDELQSAGAS